MTDLADVAPVPVAPRKRCVFSYQCAPNVVTQCPLVIDPSGQYFRRDAHSSSRFLTGISPPEEHDPDCFENEPHAPPVDFEQWDALWEGLAARVPHFEAVKMTGAWAVHPVFAGVVVIDIISIFSIINNNNIIIIIIIILIIIVFVVAIGFGVVVVVVVEIVGFLIL